MKDWSNIVGYIYKITSPHGKIYIGQTVNLKHRKKRYKLNDFKGQVKLWNDCVKYKWNPIDNFEVIDECTCGDDKINLNEREINWIKYYNSYYDGLNSTLGGKGNLGYNHTTETKETLSLKTKEQWSIMTDEEKLKRSIKLSEQGKNRKHSIETINKIKKTKSNNPYKHTQERKNIISEKNKGNKKRLGKHHSDETKNKISETKKGVNNYKLMKKVYCITNNQIYDSITDATKKLSLPRGKVSLVCLGKRNSTGGFNFKFYE